MTTSAKADTALSPSFALPLRLEIGAFCCFRTLSPCVIDYLGKDVCLLTFHSYHLTDRVSCIPKAGKVR